MSSPPHKYWISQRWGGVIKIWFRVKNHGGGDDTLIRRIPCYNVMYLAQLKSISNAVRCILERLKNLLKSGLVRETLEYLDYTDGNVRRTVLKECPVQHQTVLHVVGFIL